MAAQFPLLTMLTLALAAPAFAAPWCAAGASPRAELRPNVLLILADDHAYHALGAAGSKHARTPSLDRLAAGGALYTRAYTLAPVCTPSRQSLLTGRYPIATGVTLLETALGDQEITLAEVLAAAGYRTAAIGKMHFQSARSHGFQTRVDLADHAAWLARQPDAPLPPGRPVLGPWRPFKDPAATWLNAAQLPVGATEERLPGTFFARAAEHYLASRDERPFFLVVSFYEPHSPFHFPLESAGTRDPKTFEPPPVTPGDASRIPLIFQGLTEEQKRGIAASYHTSVDYLDRNVGRVLAALEGSGHASDTLVIYAGDNGYLLGEHGRFEKHTLWEEAVRVPLLLRWPEKVAPGLTRSELVELVDVMPTVLEACGVTPPRGLHGRSLLPALVPGGQPAAARSAVFSFYHENEEAMVRTERWKLVHGTGRRARQDGYVNAFPTPGREVRLYDEISDPAELNDVAGLPGNRGVVEELERLLLDRLDEVAPPWLSPPQELSLEDRLDAYLVPPETRGLPPPGVVVAYSPAATRQYIGSPSLAVLPSGAYLASHDLFGPGSTRDRTRVYRSADRGERWERLCEIEGQWWSSLFVHQGAVYLIGTARQDGFCVIRRSDDSGLSWTTPRDASTGLLHGDGGYHCAPVPLVAHNGRLWRAMEDVQGPGERWGKYFRSFVMSAPLESDLLLASSWTSSTRLGWNESYLGGKFGGWLEGNVVVSPEGQVVNLLRVDFRAGPEKLARVEISADGREAHFDAGTGFVDFPGGCKKFQIRRDPRDGSYWALSNHVPPDQVNPNPERTRNTLALLRSTDLRSWEIRRILLKHPDPVHHGFQYPDWHFEGEDIIALLRTAYDDASGGAHNQHDANFLTFHRFPR